MTKNRIESLTDNVLESDVSPTPIGYLLHSSDQVVQMFLTDGEIASNWRRLGEKVEDVYAASHVASIRSADCSRIEELEEQIENAQIAASETQPSWKHRCHMILGALGLDYGDPDWMIPGDRKKLEAALARVAELEERLQEKALGQDEMERLLGLENDLRGCAVVFDTVFGEDGAWHVRSVGSFAMISSHSTRWDAIAAAAKFDCGADADV
jgi:hypothetical protein